MSSNEIPVESSDDIFKEYEEYRKEKFPKLKEKVREQRKQISEASLLLKQKEIVNYVKTKQNIKDKQMHKKELQKKLQSQGQVHTLLYDRRRGQSVDEKKNLNRSNKSIEEVMGEMREEKERKKIYEGSSIFDLTNVSNLNSMKKVSDLMRGKFLKKKSTMYGGNPYAIFGSADMWNKIQKDGEAGKPVSFPGIGIVHTPIYKMIKEREMENTKDPKKQLLVDINSGRFAIGQNTQKKNKSINIEKIKKQLAKLPVFDDDFVDPAKRVNVLSHKMNSMLNDKKTVWALDFESKQKVIHDTSALQKAITLPKLASFSKYEDNISSEKNTMSDLGGLDLSLFKTHIFTNKHKKIKLRRNVI